MSPWKARVGATVRDRVFYEVAPGRTHHLLWKSSDDARCRCSMKDSKSTIPRTKKHDPRVAFESLSRRTVNLAKNKKCVPIFAWQKKRKKEMMLDEVAISTDCSKHQKCRLLVKITVPHCAFQRGMQATPIMLDKGCEI